MKTEKEKMLAGELYDALDAELSEERERCRDLCKLLNDSTGAFRFVRANLRLDDAVPANEPHPHATYLETDAAHSLPPEVIDPARRIIDRAVRSATGTGS